MFLAGRVWAHDLKVPSVHISSQICVGGWWREEFQIPSDESDTGDDSSSLFLKAVGGINYCHVLVQCLMLVVPDSGAIYRVHAVGGGSDDFMILGTVSD